MATKDERSAGRALHTKLKTAKGRTVSQQNWLQRQLNDPYVAAAKRAGYRSRAAWKLVELDERFHRLKPGIRILDLGATPGGWTQDSVEKAGDQGRVLAVDINPMDEVAGATFLLQDFLAPGADARVEALLGGQVELVLSDMAAPATGHRQTDHTRIMLLCEAALDFAETVLAPGGSFVAKVLTGGTENTLLTRMKKSFAKVTHAKPQASRKDSAESYVVAMGFRGGAAPASDPEKT